MMWNYNIDEMPKDGTEIIVICQIPDGEHFVRMISYQNEKWMTVETPKTGFLINAIKCWALAPEEPEEDLKGLIDWFDQLYPCIAKYYGVPYWKGLRAIRDRIEFKLRDKDRSHEKETESDSETNKPKYTVRGFVYYRFKDYSGNECILQESSLAEEGCVWLGKEKNQGPHHVTGHVMSPMMHLTQSQARWLGEKLIAFAETGELLDDNQKDNIGHQCSVNNNWEVIGK